MSFCKLFNQANYLINEKKINFGLTFLFSIFLLIRCFSLNSETLKSILLLFEVSVLVFYCFRQNVEKFFLILIFLGVFSFEFSIYYSNDFVNTEFFSLFHIPIFGGRFFHFTLILQLLIIIKQDYRFLWLKRLKKNYPHLFYIFFMSCFMQFSGIICGLLSISVENIEDWEWFFYFFKKEFFQFGSVNILFIGILFLLAQKFYFAQKLQQLLLSMFLAMFGVAFFLFSTGYFVVFNDANVLPLPLAQIFLCFLCLFVFYPKLKNTFAISFIGLSAVVLSFLTNSSGKSWLLLMALPIIILYLSIRQKKYLLSLIFSFPLIVGVLAFLFFSESFLEIGHAKNKYEQALALISIFSYDLSEIQYWYSILPESPKIRVEEILNTALEFERKPYFAFAGKGFGGGIEDLRNAFGMFDGSSFGDDQYIKGTFISMHSSFTNIFLKYGIAGLAFFIILIGESILNWHRSPWLVIGTVWLIFFYGYSFSIALWGIPALLLGFYEVDFEKSFGESLCCRKLG